MVSSLQARDGGNNAVEKVQVDREVLGGFPFDSTDVWSGWMWWSWCWVVSSRIAYTFITFNDRHNIEMMQEYPEHFFGHVDHFSAPHSVRARDVHSGNKVQNLLAV